MSLGEYIKKYRAEHDNMSYRAFAALVGMSPQYVINLENGVNNDGKPLSPTMTTYKKIARGTGISEADLFNLIDDGVRLNPILTDEQRELLQMIPQLRPNQANFLLLIARQFSDRGKIVELDDVRMIARGGKKLPPEMKGEMEKMLKIIYGEEEE